MKKLALVVTLAAAMTAFAGENVVKRGSAIPADAKPVALAKVMASPADYTKDAVVVDGYVQAACTRAGCWMQLTPDAGQEGVRVTFKDYAFFIPKDSAGMKARAEGVAVVKVLSKEDADHLEGEGAKLVRNADGTANEVSFVANGVELRK